MAAIKVPCEGSKEQVLLEAATLALSAVNNNVDLISLNATLDNFCSESESDVDAIIAWRTEVLERYCTLAKRAGLLNLVRTQWNGQSDCTDDEHRTAPVSNKSKTNKKGE